MGLKMSKPRLPRRTMILLSPRGISLVSALVAMTVIGMAALSFVSMEVSQKKESILLKQRLTHIGLESFITQTLYTGTCSCHFDPTVNTSAAAGTLNLNTSTLADINLQSIRTGCAFSSDDNVILKVNKEVPDSVGLIVSRIAVKNLTPTGSTDEYSGNLVVNYTKSSQKRLLNPISIPLIFSIDSTLGTPLARSIQSCWKDKLTQDQYPPECAQMTGDGQKNHLVGCQISQPPFYGNTTLGFNSGVTGQFDWNRKGTSLGFQAGKGKYIGQERGYLSSSENTLLGFKSANRFGGGRRLTLIGPQFIGPVMANGAPNKTDEATLIGLNMGRDYVLSTRATVAIGTDSGRNPSKKFLAVHKSLFIGTSTVGNGHQDPRQTIIGYQAKARPKIENISETTSIGTQAKSKYGISIGHNSGNNSSRGLFIGSGAGKNTLIENVLAIGFEASPKQQSTGDYNTFLGARSAHNFVGGGPPGSFVYAYHLSSGWNTASIAGDGARNVFIGADSGLSLVSGGYNLYVGASSASYVVHSSKNVCIGWNSCKKATTSIGGNTIIGADAGTGIGGRSNIYIGYGVGKAGTHQSHYDDRFVLGTHNRDQWLNGSMDILSTLYVNNRPLNTASSRALKKNIGSVMNLKKYFQFILKTPLFTYQYKDPSRYPDKIRMGVISEELPNYLQIKKEGELSQPDWVSIYGLFAASIKWIYNSIIISEKIAFDKVKAFTDLLIDLGQNDKNMNADMDQWTKDFAIAKNHIHTSKSKMKKVRGQISDVRNYIRKKWKIFYDQSQ